MLEAVTSLLDENEIRDYQVVEQVTSKNSYSLPRLNTAVWPGYNSSVFIQECDTEKVGIVMNKINEMNHSAFNDGELIALFQWDITACLQPGSEETVPDNCKEKENANN